MADKTVAQPPQSLTVVNHAFLSHAEFCISYLKIISNLSLPIQGVCTGCIQGVYRVYVQGV